MNKYPEYLNKYEEKLFLLVILQLNVAWLPGIKEVIPSAAATEVADQRPIVCISWNVLLFLAALAYSVIE